MTTPELQRLRTEHVLSRTALRVFHTRLVDRVAVHWHEFYELVFVQHGEATHIVNGTCHRLSRGSIFLLTPADFHELLPGGPDPLELYNVVFGDDLLGDELRRFMFGTPREYSATLCGAAINATEAEFCRLALEAEQQQAGYQHVIYATLQRILVDLARHCGIARRSECPSTNSQRAIGQALTFIHHHFRSHLTLEQAAGQAHLSPNYFSERFHQTTGTPFQSYLLELRLRFALSMLSSSQVPVTDICFAAGFGTLSHFEKSFKRRYGQSPRAYRAASEAAGRQALA